MTLSKTGQYHYVLLGNPLVYKSEQYGLYAYKVASADLTNLPFINEPISTNKPLILSTGMSTEKEISKTVKLLNSRYTSYALLHCNSTYPAPLKDINLNYIKHLKREYKVPIVILP